MDSFFTWIEDSRLNDFLTETNSVFVFPAILVLHAIGMAFLVGTHAAIALRILGVAPGVPLFAMKGFLSAARAGLVLNVFSGVLLLISYPTKALTNPLFYAKLGLIAAALMLFAAIKNDVFTDNGAATNPDRRKAILLLILWAAAIAAGRFLAYTYTRLTVLH